MRAEGLVEVNNPSEILLSHYDEPLSGIAVGAAVDGARSYLIETQALVSTAAYGTPQRSATGFDSRRLNMLLAVLEKRAGLKMYQKDVFLNFAGGFRISDTGLDLSVVAAVLSSYFDRPVEEDTCFAGEIACRAKSGPRRAASSASARRPGSDSGASSYRAICAKACRSRPEASGSRTSTRSRKWPAPFSEREKTSPFRSGPKMRSHPDRIPGP